MHGCMDAVRWVSRSVAGRGCRRRWKVVGGKAGVGKRISVRGLSIEMIRGKFVRIIYC